MAFDGSIVGLAISCRNRTHQDEPKDLILLYSLQKAAPTKSWLWRTVSHLIIFDKGNYLQRTVHYKIRISKDGSSS